MQLELPKVQIHNHYDIIIRDIRNNKIIQTAYAENVA